MPLGRIRPSATVQAHLHRVQPRFQPVPPNRVHRSAKGRGSYRRRPKHPSRAKEGSDQ